MTPRRPPPTLGELIELRGRLFNAESARRALLRTGAENARRIARLKVALAMFVGHRKAAKIERGDK